MKDAAAPADAWEPSSYALAAYGSLFGVATISLVRRRKAKSGKQEVAR